MTHFSCKCFVFIVSARIQDIYTWGIQQNIWFVSKIGLKKNKQSYSRSFGKVTKGILRIQCSYTSTDSLDLGLFLSSQ